MNATGVKNRNFEPGNKRGNRLYCHSQMDQLGCFCNGTSVSDHRNFQKHTFAPFADICPFLANFPENLPHVKDQSGFTAVCAHCDISCGKLTAIGRLHTGAGEREEIHCSDAFWRRKKRMEAPLSLGTPDG
jgi:hypothetical protein